MTVRWPRIARRVIDDNEYPDVVSDRLHDLVAEIPEGPVRPLQDPTAPDADLWNQWVEPFAGQSWLEVPWFFGETYFYRRILEAIGYFGAGPTRQDDPFDAEKRRSGADSVEAIRSLVRARSSASERNGSRATLPRLLRMALWGNQADLSMWATDEAGPDHLEEGGSEEHILSDDTDRVLAYLEALDRPVRVDVWIDNAGLELVADLVLVDGLLEEVADLVVLHAKAHPTFVSDATAADVHATVRMVAEVSSDESPTLDRRLATAFSEGRLRLSDAFAWTSPLPAREFPSTVSAELARSDLLISKGDANYRRLLGDRHWPYTTPFEDIVSYWPVPVLALRTLKAEIAAGVPEERIDWLNETHPDWLTSGEWGVIQFSPGADA